VLSSKQGRTATLFRVHIYVPSSYGYQP